MQRGCEEHSSGRMIALSDLARVHLTIFDLSDFFFQAEDGIRDYKVTGVQTCALPICAGGGIGFGELARAKPDGYTIGFINTPNVLTIPIERKSSFHWSQYDLLGNLVDDPGGFAIHNSNAITTLAGLAAYARANPGAVTVGTDRKSTRLNSSHLVI